MARSSKIISIVAVLLLVVLAVPFPLADVARATGPCQSNVWVAPPPLGNDGNPGTASLPFAHIQTGIFNVCDGGTVHVAAGTYNENLSICSAKNLTGAGAPTTIIDGGGTDTVIAISSNPNEINIISGFTIQGGNSASADLRNPADEQVLYAGIKLPSIKTLPQLFGGNDGFICGGGIYINQNHIVTLNDCTIKDNAAVVGGGICNNGVLYMNRCTVSGNTAILSGGGISNEPFGFPVTSGDHGGPTPGSMFLTNCTISGNKVGGGLIGPPGQDINVANVTDGIHGGEGGGIFNSGHMELLNCTIANNSANDTGGGFVNISPTTAIFKNTIVANNTAGTPGTNNGFNDLGGVIISLGHNLDSENSCGFNQTGDLISTDPMLGPLQDNGGPTFTHALLQGSTAIDNITQGSPAIDAGDNNGAPDTDQRGITRPQGPSVDIGAYEAVPTAVPTVTMPRYSPPPPVPPTWTRLNPAAMSVQFVSVSPRQVAANQPVTISTNVVNTGDAGGNYNVALKINGQVEQTRMVSVGPQGTQPIKFAVTRAQPGTYSVDIDGQKGSFTILGGQGTGKAPVNGGLIVILVLGVLVIASVMVLLLSRRPA
jgi:hypothetical protein